ncbi:MAG TPA: bacteriohemerythrin [Rhodoferax sp.]|jgi:hemerythrin-like metal-binding protein|nr:bacteriohemerythrin [Rhodoferax sp.]HPW83099.1 bacteriohemerythrin [Rhodoferax sp.]HQC87049.1 bacteriohemerythrin [Rhodoferax sp.]HQY77881.1 bacteriohemerythrin [Rhodoferax sp.]
MAYFDWADDMVIDGGAIDADHRRLVDLVNALHTATTEGRGREVVEGIMKELLEYTTAHLRREEAQMASVGFPHLERHKIGHDHFVAQLAELQKKYEAGSITVAAQLSTVLRDWLSLHIRRSDKELKSYVEKLGR